MQISQFQARIDISSLRNQIDLNAKKQIIPTFESVEVAELRGVYVLDMFFYVT